VSPEDGFDETLVLLHAGGVRVEAMFELLLGLAKEFRVIAPLFPEELNEIEDYVAGLILIMRHETVKRAHFYGDSFGALVAHHFVFRHPTRVMSCTLVHATCPSEMRAAQVRKALKKLDSNPSWPPIQRLLTGYGLKSKDLDEQVLDLEAGERDMIITMFRKFASSRTALVARLEAILDLFDNCEYTPDKFARFNGRLLLLESEDDPTFDITNFEKICTLHPNACVHYFKGTGLVMPLVRPKRVIQLIAKFLTDEESESVTRSHHDVRTTNDDTEDATSKDIVNDSIEVEFSPRPQTDAVSTPARQ
jgi:pimeloyl-ACP methyl ester carboxylesterase